MRRALFTPIRVVLLCTALTGGLSGWAGPGAAQAGQPPEFWIAPERYAINVDDLVVAHLRLGLRFDGEDIGFAPGGLHRFEVMSGDHHRPVEGLSGDLPAVQIPAQDEGLAVIVHESTGPLVTWTDWAEFAQFATDRDFPWALEDHRDRGLPETGFRQSSQRFAKALIAVGDGAGQDHAVGFETEIVALANPYTDDLTAGMPLLVLYQGKPRKNARLTVQCRDAEGGVSQKELWTDMDGKVRVEAPPGTEFLIDAVVLRPLTGSVKDGTPVWEALWASLTFRTPDLP